VTIGERLQSLPGMTYRSLGEGIDAAKPVVATLLAREGWELDYDEGFEFLVTPPPPYQRAHHWRSRELRRQGAAGIRMIGRGWRVSRFFEGSRQYLSVEISVYPSPRSATCVVECHAMLTQRAHEWIRHLPPGDLEQHEARAEERDRVALAKAAAKAAAAAAAPTT